MGNKYSMFPKGMNINGHRAEQVYQYQTIHFLCLISYVWISLLHTNYTHLSLECYWSEEWCHFGKKTFDINKLCSHYSMNDEWIKSALVYFTRERTNRKFQQYDKQSKL